MSAEATQPSREKRVIIRKAAVLGAGTMGSRIAAHLANAGLPVVLLDISNALAASALENLKKAKPAGFYDPAFARLITVGNFEDDLGLVSDCDWIIEAVAEDLEIKRSLLKRVQSVRRADALITTN